jgi:Tol biopolymer transport system component
VSAQAIRLNRELPRGSFAGGGDVTSLAKLSPDGNWAVYVADEIDEVRELFSTPADGSASARRLNAPFSATQGFGPSGATFEITPTSDRVLYVADQATDGAFELWSAPIDGSAPPVRVSEALAPGRDARLVAMAADGVHVVYRADPNTLGLYEIWSARVDGSQPPVKLDGPGGSLAFGHVEISPDSAWVVYQDDEATPGVTELWRVPLDGSAAAVRVHAPLAAFADVTEPIAISPDSTRVVYVADASVDRTLEVWSAPLDGSTPPTSLTPAQPNGRITPGFEIASDSSGVLIRMDRNVAGRVELYWSTLVGGGAPVLLSGSLLANSDVGDARLTPDGTTAVFVADAEVDNVEQIYSVPIDLHRPRLRLSATSGTDESFLFPFQFAANGARVVYSSRQSSGFNDLWSAPLEGGSPPLRLDTPGQGNLTGVESFQVAPGGTWVHYVLQTPRGVELWAARADGSTAPHVVQRARRLTAGGSPFASSTTRVVYVADAETDNLYELWSRTLDGTGPALRISGALGADPILGDVSDYHWAPDGERVLYRADQDVDRAEGLHVVRTDERPNPRKLWASQYEGQVLLTELSTDGRWVAWRSNLDLLTAPLDGSATPIVRSTGFSPLQATGSSSLTPDGQRVVYVVDLGGHGPRLQWLYSAPIEAQFGVLLARNETGDDIVIRRFACTPDSRRVVLLDQLDGVTRLSSVPVDGSARAALLVVPSGPVHEIDAGFQIASDSRHVVFVADLERDGVFELYSQPLARDARRVGVPFPVRLNAPLGPAQDVDFAFRITADGKRVVYAADQDNDDVFELYSVPIRGGTPVKLSGPMVAGGDVGLGVARTFQPLRLPQFELSPDGKRVVYRADQDADEVFELFSAPIDGSTIPTRLHPALAPNGDVALLSARIDPSSTTVVFGADASTDDVLEVFAAPLDGSAAPIRLSGPMIAGGDLWTRPTTDAWQMLEVSPDGASVAYLADQDADEVVELYAVPLDGSAPARRLSGPMVAGGDVRSPAEPLDEVPPFRFRPDGRALTYLADQRTDEVTELFLSFLDLEHVRPARDPSPPGD